MGKKKDEKVVVSFEDSMSSIDVTGSMIYVKTPNHNILLDVGMHQSNDRYSDYQINNRKFKGFKPKEIDYIFVSHQNADHVCLGSLVYKRGCKGTTIISKGSYGIMKKMVEDSTYITVRDASNMSDKENKNVLPIYDEEDTALYLSHTIEATVGEIHKIDDELSYKFIGAGHILGACQIILYITINGATKRIGYTGDIGNPHIGNKFVGTFEPITEQLSLCIGEATYGDRPDLKVGKKVRKTDLNKLKSIIDTQVNDLHGRVIIPSFAQSRQQSIAYMIYSLYKDNEEFQPKVYIDSPLGISIFEEYLEVLEGSEKEEFKKMMDWKNLIFVRESEDSKALVQSNEPCVVLASSGMISAGRVRHHIKKQVSNPNSTILFVGYSSEGSIASLLRDPKVKTISIDNKDYVVKCSSYALKSMSCHQDFATLCETYRELNTERLVLHHGSELSKNTLAERLRQLYSKDCKTTKVSISNNSMKITL